MIKMNAKQWLTAVVALPLLSALAGLPVAAWGPYSQAVIADRAAESLGTPKGTEGLDFINSTVVAKGWEYADRAYVKVDPNFTRVMEKFGSAALNRPQVLAWGCAQAAETAGDHYFFYKAGHPYDRWLMELMVDANLVHGTGDPGVGDILKKLGVTSAPELLAGTSKIYCSTRSPSAPFSALHALQRAEMQALAMIAERVIIDDQHFQANAAAAVPASWFEDALSASVKAASDYIAYGLLEQPELSPDIGSDVADHPTVLLSKVGSILCSEGAAVFDLTVNKRVARIKIDIVSKLSNEIARGVLKDVVSNEDEHPDVRQLARMLLDAMSPEMGVRSFID